MVDPINSMLKKGRIFSDTDVLPTFFIFFKSLTYQFVSSQIVIGPTIFVRENWEQITVVKLTIISINNSTK